MMCKKCNKPLIVESLGDGKKRMKCNECGMVEVQDDHGRKLLTETLPRDSPPQVLLG
jgi:hypothetical protein